MLLYLYSDSVVLHVLLHDEGGRKIACSQLVNVRNMCMQDSTNVKYLTKEVISPTLEISNSPFPHGYLLLSGKEENCIWNVAGNQKCQLDTLIFSRNQMEGASWDV